MLGMFDRRLVQHIDWTLLGLALILFWAGVLNLFSASALRVEGGLALTPFYIKQMVWGGAGFLVMFLVMLIDYRHLKPLSWYLYILTIIFLLCVPIWGKTIYGARRWLGFGFFNFQPSELAKVSVLILGASVLTKTDDVLGWKDLIKVMSVALLPAILIIKQPDLGSGLILILILGGMILYKGLKKRVFKTLALSFPLLLPLSWNFLHDYQKERILTFLNPERDPLGSGYHIIQSQIAIGSGRFWGKGFLEGTQSQLRFLPEKHTDFAFAVFGEEWGFVGTVILLSFFCFFFVSNFFSLSGGKG
jgi:rod shape determining protein RodA